jgi:hypothetical protein
MFDTSGKSTTALRAQTLPAAAIDEQCRIQMYGLLAAHYRATAEEAFLRDLAEKDWVVLLHTAAGALKGFSTLKLYRSGLRDSGSTVRVLFSGDTVIDRAYWGTQALAFEWIRFAGTLKGRDTTAPLYWFLISKGHRTYRYLSAFARDYWPHFGRMTPLEAKALMDGLAHERFGPCYDPKRGIVCFPDSRGHLAPELAEIPSEDLRRPEVAFFLRANPGYRRGEELVCLTELSTENLKPLARRLFLKGLSATTVSEDAHGAHELDRAA